MLVTTITTLLVSVGQLGEVKFTLFSSLHSSGLSTPMSQSGEGTRAIMSRIGCSFSGQRLSVLVMTITTLLVSVSQLGEVKVTRFSSLSTFSANIIELGEDPETVLSTRVSMQVTGSADCLSLVWLGR